MPVLDEIYTRSGVTLVNLNSLNISNTTTMELTEITKTNIKFIAIAQTFGITVKQIGSTENADKTICMKATREILRAVGLPEAYINGLLDRNSQWHWLSLYDYIMVAFAIELAERVAMGNQQCEVGLKYPQYRKHLVIKRYNLSLSGVYEPEFSRKRPESQKTFYQLYQNPEKTISFSYSNEIGYAGLTFPTLNDAHMFGVWFTSCKSFNAKDINMFFNGLGGMRLKDVKEFNENCNLAVPLSV